MSVNRRESWAEALQADFEEASRNVTVAMIAAHLSKSTSHIYQMIRGELPFSLAFLATWYDLTGAKHLMRWAGRITNHHVAPIPMGQLDDLQYADLLREFSDVVQEYTKAVADGEWTREEAAQVGQQLDELVTMATRLKISVERRATTIPLRPKSILDAERKAGA